MHIYKTEGADLERKTAFGSAAEYTGISAADQIQQRSERMKFWLYKANEIVALRRHGLDEGG